MLQSQLQMLKEAKELVKMVSCQSSLPHSSCPYSLLKQCENVITRSMAQTNVHVVENILRQEAILLPAVHQFFISCASETSEADNL